jgi:DNA-directed RNA polymerase subunit alpha
MAILAFQQPDKVIMIQSDEFKGTFEFRPLEPGFSMTIGNALRRILFSSLEGFAITGVRIDGIEHEFSSIKGVMQDVTEIILNLKQIRFKRLIESEEAEQVHVVIGGSNVFKAGDINKFLTNFQVLNPELEICRMEPTVKLNMDITIHKGRGYVSAEDNKDINAPLGTIAMDSINSHIKNVKYTQENYRVEQKTDYERLVFEITTDGSIHPKEALKEAAKVLIQHFVLFSDEKIIPTLDKEPAVVGQDEFDEASTHIRQLLKTKLTDMDLSVRALNCLKAAELETLGQLVSYNRNDLLKFRNFGKKSLTELDNMVKTKGLEFGMKVEKYKLDKE